MKSVKISENLKELLNMTKLNDLENVYMHLITDGRDTKVNSGYDYVKEINNLVNNGFKEIVLTGIHTGSYGKDLDGYSFSNLVFFKMLNICIFKPCISNLFKYLIVSIIISFVS